MRPPAAGLVCSPVYFSRFFWSGTDIKLVSYFYTFFFLRRYRRSTRSNPGTARTARSLSKRTSICRTSSSTTSCRCASSGDLHFFCFPTLSASIARRPRIHHFFVSVSRFQWLRKVFYCFFFVKKMASPVLIRDQQRY